MAVGDGASIFSAFIFGRNEKHGSVDVYDSDKGIPKAAFDKVYKYLSKKGRMNDIVNLAKAHFEPGKDPKELDKKKAKEKKKMAKRIRAANKAVKKALAVQTSAQKSAAAAQNKSRELENETSARKHTIF